MQVNEFKNIKMSCEVLSVYLKYITTQLKSVQSLSVQIFVWFVG